MKKLVVLIALLLLVLLLLPQRIFSRHPYNVILITVDTLRADYVSCYNPDTPATPGMDAIAKEGVLFANARTLIPITTPAHLSMLSSRRPHEASLFDNGQFFEMDTPFLSEILAKEDYRTAAFVSLGVLRRVFGLSRGFETFEDDFQKNHRWYMLASEINALALPWLEKHRNDKFFAWIHYSDPHEPYVTVEDPPDTEVWINGNLARTLCLAKQERTEWEFQAPPGETLIEFRSLTEMARRVTVLSHLLVRPREEGVDVIFDQEWKGRRLGNRGTGEFKGGYATIQVVHEKANPVSVILGFEGRVLQTTPIIQQNYAAEVLYTDHHIAELWQKLEDLGIRDRTIVILTADHGESLGEHDRIGHLFPLWKQIIDVPFIVYYPGTGWKGKRINHLVSHLDIAPTALDLMNKEVPPQMQGKSLKRYLSWAPADSIFGEFASRRTFAYTFAPQGRANMYATEEKDLKLIVKRVKKDWEWEAYNVSNDPAEKTNLVTDPAFFDDSSHSALRSILEDYRREAEEAYAHRTAPKLKEDEIEMLRSLGYVAN